MSSNTPSDLDHGKTIYAKTTHPEGAVGDDSDVNSLDSGKTIYKDIRKIGNIKEEKKPTPDHEDVANLKDLPIGYVLDDKLVVTL